MGVALKRETAQNPHHTQPWYDAYMAALFESDREQIGERIKVAEQMIHRREREIFPSFNAGGEQRALNNALHALQALDGCLKS